MTRTKLVDVCDFQGGSQPPKDQWKLEQLDGYVRMLQIRDFTQSSSVTPEYVKISKSLKLCEKDDILIARYGASLGKILTGLSGAYNVAIMKTIPDLTKIDRIYLKYYLLSNSFQNYILNIGSRAAQAGFNKEELSKLTIELPQLSEQHRIIRILELVDDNIVRYEKQIDDLNLLVKSRFIEMFGLLLTQEKAVTLENLISQNIITYHLDGNHGGLYPKADEFVRTGVPYLGANAIIDGRIDFKKAKFLTESKASILRKGIAQNGDVLFAHNATVGPVAILKTDYKKVIVSTSLTVYRCNNRRILPAFIKYFMESEFFVNQYKKDMKQTTRNQVPITHQKKFMFIVPPIELQNQFSDFVAQVDKSKLAVQQSLNELETLKKSLMQQYFG